MEFDSKQYAKYTESDLVKLSERVVELMEILKLGSENISNYELENSVEQAEEATEELLEGLRILAEHYELFNEECQEDDKKWEENV
ncbi:hypothetical protein [Enterococcus phage SSsP-1]|uniref:Uncharacterized protein n=1 Tax=Enterococcus phage SSsP-1 TaxID=2859527 RepID=A0AAE7WFS3_9CAUD|nr:hypothetical protein [Enterococcus phage SSsP-1]